MLHGLGANRYTFHFPGRSLAYYLADAGFDCYVAELRGAGESDRPSTGWDLEDYLRFDLPALIERVKAESGFEEIGWVGHSMGGILLLTYLSMNPTAPICCGVTIGSALDIRVGATGFERLKRLLPLIRKVRWIPYGTMVHTLSPILGRRRNRLDEFNFHPGSVEGWVARVVHANAFGRIPTQLMVTLSRLLEPTGLTLDGRQFPADLKVEKPIFMLAGGGDRQVAKQAVCATAARIAADVVVFGHREGSSRDYGHFDLILGRKAPSEVWPQIAQWLSKTIR